MTELATAPAAPAADTPASTSAPDTTPAKTETVREVVEVRREESNSERIERERDEVREVQRKAYRNAQKDRADDGKYKAKAQPLASGDQAAANLNPAESAAPKAEAKAETKATDVKTPAPIETKVDQPKAVIDPPKSWSSDKKAVWDTLSPEAREYVSQREAEAHKAISQYGQQMKAAKPIFETLHKYQDVFKASGLTYDQGVARLLEVQKSLDTNPADAIQRIAAAYQVDLADLAIKGLESPQRVNDPRIDQMQQYIASLEQRLNSVSSDIDHRKQADQTQALSNAASVFDQFAKDKPDIQDLVPQMEIAIGTIQKYRLAEGMEPLSHLDLLNEAYEAAAAMNPKVREARRASEIQKAEQARIEAARKAAEDARASAAINVRSSPSPSGEVDIRELQREAYRRAQGRAA